MRIVTATQPDEFRHAARLMTEFLEWTRDRFSTLPDVVDAYYDMSAWESELQALDTHYASPGGAVLLALDGDEPIGCVALIRFDDSTCEMKRLFVSNRCKRRGAGRALCAALLDRGRELGFGRMRLETGDLQVESHALYRSLGFYEIAPYRDHPQHLLDHMFFMEIEL